MKRLYSLGYSLFCLPTEKNFKSNLYYSYHIYIRNKINISLMELIQTISFIIALILMPFLCRGEAFPVKLIYIVCMTLLTPIFGYPVYWYIITH